MERRTIARRFGPFGLLLGISIVLVISLIDTTSRSLVNFEAASRKQHPSLLGGGEEGALDKGNNSAKEPSSSSGKSSISTPPLPPPTYRWCRAPVVPGLSTESQPLIVQYECKGEKYDNFTRRMKQYADDHYYSSYSTGANSSSSSSSSMTPPAPGEQGSSWGHAKDFPLPANKTVLVIGNSHTRQVSFAVLCQYADKVRGFETSNNEAYSVTFRNGAKWISITNRAIFYNRDWSQLLIYEMPSMKKDPRKNVDAIILGKFNNLTKHPMFSLDVQNQQKQLREKFPGIQIDFHQSAGPDLLSVATEYNDIPTIAVTEFAKDGAYILPQWKETIDSLNRNNVALIDGRAHVGILGECGTDKRRTTGICYDAGPAPERGSAPPSDMHRCTGENGGHADLIGWDIVNKLHELLEQSMNA